ncbi:Dolichyl-diphosphooligosaccharide-protein glycosyltransferase 48kDa subunit family protein [Hibiscus syriacus]|uniref:Dolichyl-diphosphooligosaccharide-protein glycosyltransferase 48kDa subunit family protein n=1 Tax=Hibiscus syriacus TaxID=106335 RepID=A0A6A3C8Q4_HIBSY|nr:Dolichyl-diphosphooligosaccharide-protein glycosyltransferase 48kDa subunit family protein [Hibiscus syriacus]
MEGYAKLMVVTMVVIGLALGSGPIVANGQKVSGMSKEGFQAFQLSVANPNPPLPSAPCCMALNDGDLTCLCFFKNSKWMTDYGVDFNRAKELPVKCNLGKDLTC